MPFRYSYNPGWHRQNLRCSECGIAVGVKYLSGGKPYCNGCVLKLSQEDETAAATAGSAPVKVRLVAVNPVTGQQVLALADAAELDVTDPVQVAAVVRRIQRAVAAATEKT